MLADAARNQLKDMLSKVVDEHLTAFPPIPVDKKTICLIERRSDIELVMYLEQQLDRVLSDMRDRPSYASTFELTEEGRDRDIEEDIDNFCINDPLKVRYRDCALFNENGIGDTWIIEYFLPQIKDAQTGLWSRMKELERELEGVRSLYERVGKVLSMFDTQYT